MSEEKKVTKKAEEPKGFGKFVEWCKKLPGRIAKPFKRMANELRRVTWPTKRKLIIYSCVVLVFMLFMGIVIGLFDLGSSALIRVIKPV